MRYLAFFSLVLATSFGFAKTTTFTSVETKLLAEDMAAMTRSFDVLMAREEMKGTLSLAMVQAAARKLAGQSTDGSTKKMELLVEPTSLQDCKTDFKETKSPSGDVADIYVEYAGDNCPLKLMGKGHIVTKESGAVGDLLIEIQIVSPKLKGEFDLESMKLPIHLDVSAAPANGGFALEMKIDIGGEITSQKWGLVSYAADMKSVTKFGSTGVEMRSENNETYSGAGKTTKFSQIVEANNASQTETFLVDGNVVSKEEFSKAHGSVSLPGFNNQEVALEQPHACNMTDRKSVV